MLLQTVIEVFFINLCFRSSWKSAADCCQTLQIQQDAWGSARIACVTVFSTTPLYSPQMLEKEQRSSNNPPNFNAMKILCLEQCIKLFWNLHPKPKTVSLHGENMGQFSAGPVNKAVLSFRNSLIKVRKW